VTREPQACADKICASCGRAIEWRKRWARHWDAVRYCSDACRGRRVSPEDAALEATILELLATRPRGATICPSDAARKRHGDDEARWRPAMEDVRRAARRLVAMGRLEIVARGQVLEPSRARGAIRLRLVDGR
jgi:hypothetical protein